MESAFAELPLAVFTTLAPIGAAGFIAFAVITLTAQTAGAQSKYVDKMSLAPFIVALAGFAASALHLANPLKAAGVIAGIGSSPLTNEVMVGGVFMAVAFVYVALAFTGKLDGIRKPYGIVVAVLAVVFCIFVGLAYMIPTISSWNTALLPLQIVGYALVGGCGFGALALANSDDETKNSAAKVLRVIAVCGAVLAIVTGVAQLASVASTTTAVAYGSSIAATVAPFAAIGMVLVAVAAAELWLAFSKGITRGAAVRAIVETVVGVFLIRLAFYAMYLSVGLTML